MKYRIWLKILQILVYIKRFFWWLGAKIIFVLAKIFSPIWGLLGYVSYKIDYIFKKISTAAGLNGQFLKRDNLQIVVLLLLFFLAVPQTKLLVNKDLTSLPGQKTIAYNLTSPEEDYTLEEVTADNSFTTPEPAAWKQGSLGNGQVLPENGMDWQTQEYGGVMAGGSALSKPIIFPGASLGGARDKVMVYTVEPGDSLSEIAAQFNVSIATVLWENNLGLTSYIRPGDRLRILPITGLTHTVKKGDTLKKIAALYGANVSAIVSYNKLQEDGSDLVAGEQIIVPDGIKPQQKAVASIPRTYSSFVQVAAPPSSKQLPSVSGFIWPTGARIITQYFSWKHQAVDIAGPLLTPNYASKAGVVEFAACGWNSGYGCMILINNGGGVKTRYSHNEKLLVKPGEYVQQGQTIGLMGNTGNVRGITGIHIDFRLYINGVAVNPLKYIHL